MRQENSSHFLHCKKRNPCGALGYILQPSRSAAVARRNERERNRVRLVNMGFAKLRKHVPNKAKNRKLSKVETLRSAAEYIKELQELLTRQESNVSNETTLNTAGTETLSSGLDSLPSPVTSSQLTTHSEDLVSPLSGPLPEEPLVFGSQLDSSVSFQQSMLCRLGSLQGTSSPGDNTDYETRSSPGSATYDLSAAREYAHETFESTNLARFITNSTQLNSDDDHFISWFI
ncbi:uncharacterized protein LOC143256601 [Tachypleus tridentatus]|uniref:uncharacterized protein LOC143256601 n=1 Tax=Tachypleus tridentatus TaxID=6853 RepID=UPI003FD35A49